MDPRALARGSGRPRSPPPVLPLFLLGSCPLGPGALFSGPCRDHSVPSPLTPGGVPWAAGKNSLDSSPQINPGDGFSRCTHLRKGGGRRQDDLAGEEIASLPGLPSDPASLPAHTGLSSPPVSEHTVIFAVAGDLLCPLFSGLYPEGLIKACVRALTTTPQSWFSNLSKHTHQLESLFN